MLATSGCNTSEFAFEQELFIFEKVMENHLQKKLKSPKERS